MLPRQKAVPFEATRGTKRADRCYQNSLPARWGPRHSKIWTRLEGTLWNVDFPAVERLEQGEGARVGQRSRGQVTHPGSFHPAPNRSTGTYTDVLLRAW